MCWTELTTTETGHYLPPEHNGRPQQRDYFTKIWCTSGERRNVRDHLWKRGPHSHYVLHISGTKILQNGHLSIFF